MSSKKISMDTKTDSMSGRGWPIAIPAEGNLNLKNSRSCRLLTQLNEETDMDTKQPVYDSESDNDLLLLSTTFMTGFYVELEQIRVNDTESSSNYCPFCGAKDPQIWQSPTGPNTTQYSYCPQCGKTWIRYLQ